MYKTDDLKATEAQLAVVIADRIQLALESSGTLRAGRGRVEDFTERFRISRSTATRILGGTIVPQASLLVQIANELKVSVDWLTGRTTDFTSPDLAKGPAKFQFWPADHAGNHALTLPSSCLPGAMAATRILAITWPDQSLHPYVLSGDIVLVAPVHELQPGVLHIVQWHNERLEAVALWSYGDGKRYALKGAQGRMEIVLASDIAYGPSPRKAEQAPERAEPGDPRQVLRIIGLLVGRISFNEKGVVQLQPVTNI